MANSENRPQDDRSDSRQDADSSDGDQESADKAPGRHSESGYPNDGYWEQGDQEKPKVPPDETPEPDNGYRWESSEDNSTSEAAEGEGEGGRD